MAQESNNEKLVLKTKELIKNEAIEEIVKDLLTAEQSHRNTQTNLRETSRVEKFASKFSTVYRNLRYRSHRRYDCWQARLICISQNRLSKTCR